MENYCHYYRARPDIASRALCGMVAPDIDALIPTGAVPAAYQPPQCPQCLLLLGMFKDPMVDPGFLRY